MPDFAKLEESLGVKFQQIETLRAAFIHRSYINESGENESNERLEFLGDAVLELVTTDFLFHEFPKKQEGEMTALRAALVRKEALAPVARRLSFGEYLLLAKGEDGSGGRDKDYILANTVEAVIGAIYLDCGIKAAEGFIQREILTAIEEILREKLHIDAKSLFQEIAQAKKGVTPEYKLTGESGPDHDKTFRMGAFLKSEKVGEGEGSSKQLAEQAAARSALDNLDWK